MTLEEAIAEVRRRKPDDGVWVAGDVLIGQFASTTLNAVATGDLIPLADHKLAVALAYQRALGICALMNRRGRDEYDAGWDRCADTIADGITAHIDADALAGVQALKAERNYWKSYATEQVTMLDNETEFRIAAEAEVVRLEETIKDLKFELNWIKDKYDD